MEPYDITVCLECTNGAQTIRKKDFNITQSGKCSMSLSAKQSSLGSLQLKYSESKSSIVIGNGLNSFFENAEPDDCPITTCSLRNFGCIDPYNQEDHLSIGSSSPYDIRARMDVPLGYNKKVCVRCSNGD